MEMELEKCCADCVEECNGCENSRCKEYTCQDCIREVCSNFSEQ